jgi:hypothetical protein
MLIYLRTGVWICAGHHPRLRAGAGLINYDSPGLIKGARHLESFKHAYTENLK